MYKLAYACTERRISILIERKWEKRISKLPANKLMSNWKLTHVIVIRCCWALFHAIFYTVRLDLADIGCVLSLSLQHSGPLNLLFRSVKSSVVDKMEYEAWLMCAFTLLDPSRGWVTYFELCSVRDWCNANALWLVMVWNYNLLPSIDWHTSPVQSFYNCYSDCIGDRCEVLIIFQLV